MSTAVIIVCNHRTGSGLLSSMLHTMGIPMLPTEQPTRQGDEMWEDHRFVELHQRMLSERPGKNYDPTAWRFPKPVITEAIVSDYRRLLAQCHLLAQRRGQSRWGFKDPRTVFMLPVIVGMLRSLDIRPRFIWLNRNLEDVAASLKKRDEQQWPEWPTDHMRVAETQRTQWNIMRTLYGVGIPSFNVAYESLVVTPQPVTDKLAEFVTDPACDQPIDPALITAAAALVRRRH
jgi:hypothetical protein